MEKKSPFQAKLLTYERFKNAIDVKQKLKLVFSKKVLKWISVFFLFAIHIRQWVTTSTKMQARLSRDRIKTPLEVFRSAWIQLKLKSTSHLLRTLADRPRFVTPGEEYLSLAVVS